MRLMHRLRLDPGGTFSTCRVPTAEIAIDKSQILSSAATLDAKSWLAGFGGAAPEVSCAGPGSCHVGKGLETL